jgi:hypothetical protein
VPDDRCVREQEERLGHQREEGWEGQRPDLAVDAPVHLPPGGAGMVTTGHARTVARVIDTTTLGLINPKFLRTSGVPG